MGSSFQDVLNRPFRWPKTGDRALTQSTTIDGAWLPADRLTRFALITDGYRRAADHLVDQALRDYTERDFLVYPIVFSYRHFIELSLKYLVDSYGSYVGLEANWKTHELDPLWEAFKSMLEKHGVQSNSADPVVEACIAEFAKIDVRSFSFRYPTDTKGRLISFDVDALDLENLRDVMEGVSNYFTGTDGYLSQG